MHSTRAARSRSMSSLSSPFFAINSPSRDGSPGPRAAQHNVKRPRAAIPRLRGGDRQQMRAEFRLVEPARHGRPQHAGAPIQSLWRTAPRDNENAALAVGSGRPDKPAERAMRLVLRHAVQVEPGLDPVLAAPMPN